MRHADVIDRLGGPAEVARAFGFRPNRVVHWKQRGIPPAFWHRLATLSEEEGCAFTAHDLEPDYLRLLAERAAARASEKAGA